MFIQPDAIRNWLFSAQQNYFCYLVYTNVSMKLLELMKYNVVF